MQNKKRPSAFWVILVLLILSVGLFLAGQTIAVFDYPLAVRLGLQEPESLITPFGVQVNRAFGAGDTLIYLPLIVASIIGLMLRKSWALVTTSAVMGISAYWSSTSIFLLLFLPGASGYAFIPGPDYWLFTGSYLVFGVWGLIYLAVAGERLIA